MTDETDAGQPGAAQPPETQPAPTGRKSKISWVAVILVLLLIAVAGRAAYVWVTGGDEFNFRRFAFLGEQEITFYDVSGVVLFNGEPLTQGHIDAHSLDPEIQPDRVVGPIKSDGTFKLFTDFGGTLNEGAPAGQYKVLLILYHPTLPLEAPVPLLPLEYYSVRTTPITITVSPDSAKNKLTIEAQGQFRPKVPPGQAPGDKSDGAAPTAPPTEPEAGTED